jgi:hypothetical protein
MESELRVDVDGQGVSVTQVHVEPRVCYEAACAHAYQRELTN